MTYEINITLNEIWKRRAADCNMKKKEIAQVIKGINFKKFDYKQFMLIHKRLKAYHEKNPMATSDATTDLWWFIRKYYGGLSCSWVWRTPRLQEAWHILKQNNMHEETPESDGSWV